MSKPADFDRIARPYRTLEYLTLGKKLEQTRMYFLPELLTARRALVLGDGDGRFLTRLLAANTHLEATAIDSSVEMLNLLRRRCAPFLNRVETIQMDAVDFTPRQMPAYDLVISHFFLDCFTEQQLKGMIRRIVPALAPDARWVISDFRIPSGTMRLPGWLVVRSLYLAFRILTGLRTKELPQHAFCLSEAGFRREQQGLVLSGMLTAELWRFSEASEEEKTGDNL